MNLGQLIVEIESDFPNDLWLLRKMPDGSYFAHITTPNFPNPPPIRRVGDAKLPGSYKSRSTSAHGALSSALKLRLMGGNA